MSGARGILIESVIRRKLEEAERAIELIQIACAYRERAE
jgi:hypothetical protein